VKTSERKRFKDKQAEKLARGEISLKYQKIKQVGYKKIQMLLKANSLMDLALIPRNQLEQIGSGHSIRINDQYRLCFKWDKERQQAYDIYINPHDKSYGKQK